ncbi:amino acid ABC transporter substrate-binding protein [Pedobacter sp. Du54]|uniref:amino acid ABC transporter substrate-binding protein n=1 Tax=Pedobacter anseongensis TaxID=3133439 RepID=UPI00309E90B6
MTNLKIFFIFLLCSVFVACSPKVIKTPVPLVKTVPKTEVKQVPVKPVPKFTEANIALLIPFKLDHLNLETASKVQLERADMAIDFYQGIKMGIDSAASFGLNFKVNVYDTRDENAQLLALTKNDVLKNSNLIIGPVFPEGIKYLTDFAISNDLPIVSPLAASKPSEFKNPKLISIVNHIDQHSEKIAAYIGSKFQASTSIVVLINPKKTDDEEFAAPIRNFLKLKYPSLLVQEFSSSAVFETRMVKGKKYAVVICSSDVGFVAPTIDKIAKIAKLRAGDYEFNVFGHPNWIKQNYNTDQLQALKTIISTSYLVNYRDANVINFIKKYRYNFNFEPSEYAIKGFDIGFYFGRLIAKHGKNYLDFITKEKYRGIHNTFNFVYDPLYGYYNKDLMLLQYKNLTLSVIN